MAVKIYRLYMDERLLAQLDWGASYVYFEILLEKGFMEAPVSEAFDVGHCMPWAELSEAEMAWFHSTPRGRAILACQPPFLSRLSWMSCEGRAKRTTLVRGGGSRQIVRV